MNVNIDSISNLPSKSYNYINDNGINPIFLIILAIVIILFYTLFSFTSSTNQDTSNNINYNYLEIIIWSIFLVLIVLNAITYFYSYDLDANLSNIFTSKPELKLGISTRNNKSNNKDKDDTNDDNTNSTSSKQVYHIPGNNYTYKDAKRICKLHNATLANFNQIEDSYKSGGEWCSFGWSDNQLALYPTQKKTYEALADIKGHEHDCGRPGINGGYIDNPNIRFGINCYGVKPKITPLEQQDMNANQDFPENLKRKKLRKEMKYWKKKRDKINIAPFNRTNWSKY